MVKSLTPIAAAAVFLWVQSFAALADEVPTLNVSKSCHADIEAYPGAGAAAACLADEQRAKDVLARQWTQFAPDSRTRCMQMVTDIAGTQSYVELLSCLQEAKEVKGLRK
jgi:hypothetical protein